VSHRGTASAGRPNGSRDAPLSGGTGMMRECDPSTIADDTATAPAISVDTLLLCWQRAADADCFHRLIASVTPLVNRIAGMVLRRHGILDPSATDEVLSLVLDHLRRLPGSPKGDRTVAPYASRPRHAGHDSDDPGVAYVLCLTRDRAHDVARSRRRQARHATLFSQLDRRGTARLELSAPARDEQAALEELCGRLRMAVERLPMRERSVIELLLAGKTQATIAHTIAACEGTVSRLRSRAIAALRELLAD